MRTPTTKLLALATAAALGVAACGGGDEEAAVAVSGEARPVQEAAAPAEADPAAAEGTEVQSTVDDPASTLRAELTLLLQEHVHLTGLAVDAVVEEGEDAPAGQAAIQTLEDNAVALGAVIGGLPAVDDPEAFLEPWRQHVAAYVDYAAARAEGDDDGAAEATRTLEGLLQPMADFFEQISDEELVADELYGELETHVTMVTDAIDAHVAAAGAALPAAEGESESEGAGAGGADAEATEGDGSELLHEAALHMDVVAADLADGIVAAHAEELPGDPLGVPAETRATLVSGLVEHTYLVALAAGEVIDAGGATDDPLVQAAVTALDGSADGLAGSMTGSAGNDGREAFLDVWRPFLAATTDYAAASASGDAAAAAAARATIESMPTALAGVLQQATEGAVPPEVTGLLTTHVSNLLAAIDAMVAGDPAAYAQVRGAAQHAAAIGTTVARAMPTAQPAGGDDQGATVGEDAEGLGADPSTAAPDQSAESSSGAGTVSTSDSGSATDSAGPGAETGSEGDVDGEE
ncbi:MAG: hypothetical protein ACLGIZ_12405 [Acidimicrobiia bacterium]